MPESTHAESLFREVQCGAIRWPTIPCQRRASMKCVQPQAGYAPTGNTPCALSMRWARRSLGRRRDEVQQVLRENGVTPLKGVIVGGGSPVLDVAVTAERVP